MQRTAAIVAVVLAVLLAQQAPADAGGRHDKVGYIDMEHALVHTAAGRRARKQFGALKDRKQKALDQKQNALKRDIKSYERRASGLAPAAQRHEQALLQQRTIELQEMFVRLERELDQEQTKLLRELARKAQPEIKRLAAQEGYTMVVDRSTVLYAEPNRDLTQKLERRMR